MWCLVWECWLKIKGSCAVSLCIYLENAFDRVPREEQWECMRKSRVAEKFVRVCSTCMRSVRQWWGAQYEWRMCSREGSAYVRDVLWAPAYFQWSWTNWLGKSGRVDYVDYDVCRWPVVRAAGRGLGEVEIYSGEKSNESQEKHDRIRLNECFPEAAKVRKVDELLGRRKKEKHHRWEKWM